MSKLRIVERIFVRHVPADAGLCRQRLPLGFGVLIDGVLGVLFGFGVNWPWFANLALFAAWLFLICRVATAAAIFSAAAVVAAVRFFAFPRVMNNEGGVAVEVTSLEPGCYLWLASIVFALAAAAARWRFNAARKASS